MIIPILKKQKANSIQLIRLGLIFIAVMAYMESDHYPLLQVQVGEEFFLAPRYAAGKIKRMNKNEPSTSKILNLRDNRKIKKQWDTMVKDHLRLYLLTNELGYISMSNKFLHMYFFSRPKEWAIRSVSVVNWHMPYDLLTYNLGFITLNANAYLKRNGLENLSPDVYEDYRIKFIANLNFLVAMQRAGLSFDIFDRKFDKMDSAKYTEQVKQWIKGWDSVFEVLVSLEKDRAWHQGEVPWEVLQFWLNEVEDRISKLGQVPHVKLRRLLKELESLYSILERGRIPFFAISDFHFDEIKRPIILLSPEWQDQFEKDFFNHPISYIKSMEEIQSLDFVPLALGKIHEIKVSSFLLVFPGEEIGKIRKWKLRNGQEVYAKRVNFLRVRYPEEEIEIAERVNTALQKVNSNFHAQKFIGIVYGNGLFYLLSLGQTIQKTLSDERYSLEAKQIQDVLKKLKVADPAGLARLNDVIVTPDKQYYVIDFETHPYSHADLMVLEELLLKKETVKTPSRRSMLETAL